MSMRVYSSASISAIFKPKYTKTVESGQVCLKSRSRYALAMQNIHSDSFCCRRAEDRCEITGRKFLAPKKASQIINTCTYTRNKDGSASLATMLLPAPTSSCQVCFPAALIALIALDCALSCFCTALCLCVVFSFDFGCIALCVCRIVFSARFLCPFCVCVCAASGIVRAPGIVADDDQGVSCQRHDLLIFCGCRLFEWTQHRSA